MKRSYTQWICLCLAWILLCLTVSCGPVEREEPVTVTWRNLTYGIGAVLPQPKDFVQGELPEGVTVRFDKEYFFPATGEYELKILVTDSKGKEETVTVTFTLIKDEQPPVLTGVTDKISYVGDGISYRSGITVSDNCDGEITLTVDSSAVDIHRAGSYPIIYTATDACGNYIEQEVRVYVYEETVTEAQLYGLLDPIIAEQIPSGISKEQQVRRVYQYVHDHVSYVTYSDKSDWVRAAYDGLRTGAGDCFTYFALSKAFFNRLGIQSMDIKRTEGIVDERHYWNYVNIGTEQSPRWYHFDATPLRGNDHSGDLMTDVQVRLYSVNRIDENGVGNYFYAYDVSAYPQSDTKVINSTLPTS